MNPIQEKHKAHTSTKDQLQYLYEYYVENKQYTTILGQRYLHVYLNKLDINWKYHKKCRDFLYTPSSLSNREEEVLQAKAGRIPWKYSIPLYDVISYLSIRHKDDPFYSLARERWIT